MYKIEEMLKYESYIQLYPKETQDKIKDICNWSHSAHITTLNIEMLWRSLKKLLIFDTSPLNELFENHKFEAQVRSELILILYNWLCSVTTDYFSSSQKFLDSAQQHLEVSADRSNFHDVLTTFHPSLDAAKIDLGWYPNSPIVPKTPLDNFLDSHLELKVPLKKRHVVRIPRKLKKPPKIPTKLNVNKSIKTRRSLTRNFIYYNPNERRTRCRYYFAKAGHCFLAFLLSNIKGYTIPYTWNFQQNACIKSLYSFIETMKNTYNNMAQENKEDYSEKILFLYYAESLFQTSLFHKLTSLYKRYAYSLEALKHLEVLLLEIAIYDSQHPYFIPPSSYEAEIFATSTGTNLQSVKNYLLNNLVNSFNDGICNYDEFQTHTKKMFALLESIDSFSGIFLYCILNYCDYYASIQTNGDPAKAYKTSFKHLKDISFRYLKNADFSWSIFDSIDIPKPPMPPTPFYDYLGYYITHNFYSAHGILKTDCSMNYLFHEPYFLHLLNSKQI